MNYDLKGTFSCPHILLLVIALNFSCTNQREELNLNTQDILKQEIMTFANAVKVNSVVNLEFSEKALVVPPISQIQCTDNQIFILDFKREYILVFDIAGRFLYKISNLGPGPNEIENVDHFCFDKEKKNIFMLSSRGGKIIKYDIKHKNFTHISSGNSQITSAHIVQALDESTLILVSYFDEFNFYYMDIDSTNIKGYVKNLNESRNYKIGPMGDNNFFNEASKLKYLDYKTFNIYEFQKSGPIITGRIQVNREDMSLEEFPDRSSMENVWNYYRDKKYPYFPINISQKKFAFSLFPDKIVYRCGHRHHKYIVCRGKEGTGFIRFNGARRNYNEYIACSYDPTNLVKYLNPEDIKMLNFTSNEIQMEQFSPILIFYEPICKE